jgi:26S proteasome regulatory subunit (ATPase 3-interacting protein)
MNRPYGAVDVAANLKGAVPKTAVQKILVALAEKGELVQKTYGMWSPRLFKIVIRTLCRIKTGKTTFFVANQANIDVVPTDKLASIDAELKSVVEENKLREAQIRTLTTGKPMIAYRFSEFIVGHRCRAG